MRISDGVRGVALIAASVLSLGLAACSNEPDNAQLAAAEEDHLRSAADAGRVFCALGGAEAFRLDCTMDRLATANGTELVIGRADSGYRRFRLVPGRGLIAADGAEQAEITIVGDGMIEARVGTDRYRLPATERSSASR